MPQFISPNLNQLARVGGIPVDQWGDEAIGPVGKKMAAATRRAKKDIRHKEHEAASKLYNKM